MDAKKIREEFEVAMVEKLNTDCSGANFTLEEMRQARQWNGEYAA